MQKKPVLLQVLPSLVAGGVERGTVDIARAAANQGFVSLVASAGGRMEKEIMAAGAQHIALPLLGRGPLTIWRNISRLQQVIKDHKVDIIHARSRAPAWSALYAAKQENIHFMTTFHGTHSTKGPGKKYYNSVMARGEKVIAVSQHIANHIRDTYGEIAVAAGDISQRLEIIYRGVDMNLFNPSIISDEQKEHFRLMWDLQENWPVIFLPGRFTRWKGQDFLLQGLAELRQKQKDPFYCVMAGDATKHPTFVAEIRAMADSLGLTEFLRIVEPVSDMAAAYALSTVAVTASVRPEAFGRIAVEAQAMGTPLVATDIGGSCETVLPGKTGWRVAVGDNVALAEALGEALQVGMAADAREYYAAVARQHVADNFSLDIMAEKTIAIYQSLLQ